MSNPHARVCYRSCHRQSASSKVTPVDADWPLATVTMLGLGGKGKLKIIVLKQNNQQNGQNKYYATVIGPNGKGNYFDSRSLTWFRINLDYFGNVKLNID